MSSKRLNRDVIDVGVPVVQDHDTNVERLIIGPLPPVSRSSWFSVRQAQLWNRQRKKGP